MEREEYKKQILENLKSGYYNGCLTGRRAAKAGRIIERLYMTNDMTWNLKKDSDTVYNRMFEPTHP